MVIKVPRSRRNIYVAAFTNRFAVIQIFENREPARMFLYLPRQRVEIARTGMWSERLPCRQRGSRGFHRAFDICRRSLRHGRESFSRGRICRVEISPRSRAVHGAIAEVP